MKSITKLLIASSALILVLFFWKEIPNFSIHKKINADKVSAFFTALASLLTAVTVFLLYRQIQEQIEDRKAAIKPDLYPLSTEYAIENGVDFTRLNRRSRNRNDFSTNAMQLHNIGSGVAIEILVRWHYDRDVAKEAIPEKTLSYVINDQDGGPYDFIQSNNFIDIQLPSLYVASFLRRDLEKTERWDDLAVTIQFKDITGHDNKKKFKAIVEVSKQYASFTWHLVRD